MSTNKYDFDIPKDKNWEQAVKCKENIFRLFSLYVLFLNFIT
ncbi:hypothetical protein [Spiroplasma ixodetis]|nr:hypothetical protein [Spiroplasma ixodetis]WJG70139.1 hypothetical protein SIXOD_v1c11910 [Spiroplasma ixodetis Y32]